MAHCVISSVLDTDTHRMGPCCVVHTHVAPCPRDGSPANPEALHSFDGCGRAAAVRAWTIRTHRQRPFVLHHGGPARDREHNTVSPDCWCGPEFFEAVRDG